jgi:hypothetical protein
LVRIGEPMKILDGNLLSYPARLLVRKEEAPVFDGFPIGVSKICFAAVGFSFCNHPKREFFTCCIYRGDCGYAYFGIAIEEAGHTFCAAPSDSYEVMSDELPRSFVHVEDVAGDKVYIALVMLSMNLFRHSESVACLRFGSGRRTEKSHRLRNPWRHRFEARKLASSCQGPCGSASVLCCCFGSSSSSGALSPFRLRSVHRRNRHRSLRRHQSFLECRLPPMFSVFGVLFRPGT